MKTPKITRRRIILAIPVILASGLLLAGFLTWLTAVPTTPDGDDAESAQAVFKQQMLKAPETDPAKTADELQLLALGNEVGKFRDGAVTASDTKAMAQLPEVAPGALQDFLKGEISAKFPIIWPYVISGSFIVMGNALGDEPIVAFYNPYFDVAILTKWNFKDETETKTAPSFKLVEAVPITGRAFLENRSSLATDQPVWTDSEALFEVRIVKAAQDFVAAFEERYPPFGLDSVALSADPGAASSALALAEDRVFFLLRWVIDAQDPAAPVNYAAAIKQLRGALSAPSADKLAALLPKDNPQAADAFFELGPEIRKGMKPYLVIDKNVIFISPIKLPTGFISVYFTPAAKGYAPELVSLFNLEASYPGL